MEEDVLDSEQTELVGGENQVTSSENQEVPAVEESNDIMRPILDRLGLTVDFPEIYEFDKELDLDSEEGIEEVVNRSIKAGYSIFLDELTDDKELYSFYLHRKKGGDISSFKNDNIKVISNDTLNNNVDLQKQIFEDDLRKRGMSEDIIELVIQKTIDNEKLLEKAIEINNSNEFIRNEKIQEQEQERVNDESLNRQTSELLTDIVTDSIRNNKFSSLRINSETKEKLYSSLSDNIEIIKGLAYYKVQIGDDNVNALIENHLLLLNPSFKSKLVSANVVGQNIKSLKDRKNNSKGTVINKSGTDEFDSVRRNLM